MEAQFEAWWKNDAPYPYINTKELCRTAWKNGAYCALNPKPVIYNDCPDDPYDPKVDDDDFNEPLGPACQLGDETCESCQ